jgi:hypothetical protein
VAESSYIRVRRIFESFLVNEYPQHAQAPESSAPQQRSMRHVEDMVKITQLERGSHVTIFGVVKKVGEVTCCYLPVV